MQKIEKDFAEFCNSSVAVSGKGRSYAKAIRYLCDYMGIYEMNDESVNKMKSIEAFIRDKNSIFYKDFLEFLSGRGQKFYLKRDLLVLR